VPRDDGWAELYHPESRQPLGWEFFVADMDAEMSVYKVRNMPSRARSWANFSLL
jgi:hypothetical protein